MKKPDYLLPPNRKAAKYWLRPGTMDSELFGKIECNQVACGQPIADRDGSKVTTEPSLITCKVCWSLANPPKSMF